MVIALPGVGGLRPGKVGCQSKDRAIAATEVGVLLAGETGGSGSNTSIDEVVAKATKTEDGLIPSKTVLGHSLWKIYSNKRIQLAVHRSSMERLNTQLASTDV